MPDDFSAAASEVIQQTLRTLAAQNRLLLQASSCKNRQELKFHILNNTVSFIKYDRAILLESCGSGFKLLGVSGTVSPDVSENFSTLWQALASLYDSQKKYSRIRTTELSATGNIDENCLVAYNSQSGGADVLVFQMGAASEGLCLLLERWGEKNWRDKESEAFLPLLDGYAGLWSLYTKAEHSFFSRAAQRLSRKLILKIAVVLMVCLLIPLRLRIVAPCEIVARHPVSVASKIDGVIESIPVHAGQKVRHGDILIKMAPEVISEEYIAALQSFHETYAKYVSVRAGVVNDPDKMGQLVELTSQLRQDKARLKVAEYRRDNLIVRSPTDGSVIVTDPHELEGRPVVIGEKIMQITDPTDTMVRIYLPQDDRIDFPGDAAVSVILNNSATSSYPALLYYVSAQAVGSVHGGSAFIAEAYWKEQNKHSSLGAEGTAIIYGSRVPLFYWLLRRPLSVLRSRLGV